MANGTNKTIVQPSTFRKNDTEATTVIEGILAVALLVAQVNILLALTKR